MPATRSAKPPRPPSRSRFQEGSMNDRASAAPPVQFIGPESFLDVNNPTAALRSTQQPSAARGLRTKPNVGLRASGTKPSTVSSVRPVVAEDATQQQHQQQQQQVDLEVKTSQKGQKAGKRGSKQLWGQVWDGVREKFRMKKDTSTSNPTGTSTSTSNDDAARNKSASDDRPSKDEVYANYHQLVASGFFTAHAIQSTRQPGPAAQRPSTSQANGPPPQWPLPQLPLTPNKSSSRPASPVKSPASASSRGTKRAMEEDSEEDEGEDVQVNKKLRKTVSTPRDLAIPKRRSSSRLAGKRSISINRTVSGAQQQQQGGTGQSREPNKLTKRVLNRLPLSIPDRDSSASATGRRRNVSDMVPPAAAMHKDGSERTLRPRRSAADISNAGGLKVRPDANRGIPSVPGIPAKFTYGEDRENHGPWRGLRRGVNQQ